MRSNSNHQQYSENLRLVPIFFLGTKIFKDRFWEFFIRNYCHVLFWARKRRVSPPPLNWWKSKKFSLEAALFLAQKVNGKKLTERGGTPLSLTDGQFLKTQREKVDGKGGYPPPPPPLNGLFPWLGVLKSEYFYHKVYLILSLLRSAYYRKEGKESQTLMLYAKYILIFRNFESMDIKHRLKT